MAMVGGFASVISGGKFLNGAVSAAFVHLFNAEAGGTGKKIHKIRIRLDRRSIKTLRWIQDLLKSAKLLQKALAASSIVLTIVDDKIIGATFNVSQYDFQHTAEAIQAIPETAREKILYEAKLLQGYYGATNNYELKMFWRRIYESYNEK